MKVKISTTIEENGKKVFEEKTEKQIKEILKTIDEEIVKHQKK